MKTRLFVSLAALALLIWFLARPGGRSGGLIEQPKPSPVAAAASPSPDAAAARFLFTLWLGFPGPPAVWPKESSW
jgi:hypothetical protein